MKGILYFFLIFCWLFNGLCNSNTLSAQCYFDNLLPEEQQSLIDIYNASDGEAEWESWLAFDEPLTSWWGLTTGADCHVEGIDLMAFNLTLDVFSTIDLPYLHVFRIRFSQIEGTIPDFTNLPTLQELIITDCQLSSTIPNFTGLPNLQVLDLFHNQLSGTIPDFANLPNLQVLDLGYNQLSGTIPDFANLPNLQVLDLGHNQFSGTIPDFANLPNLERLTLSSNQLTGSIPNFSQPNLLDIALGYNTLSGEIPNFNLPNLQTLSLHTNDLSGELPNFNLPNLTMLYLSSNGLSGGIPNFTNLPSLESLYLGYNTFIGSIPNFNLPNLRVLNLDSSNLSGEIPNFDLPNLERLNLSRNSLSGNIPNFSLTNLHDIILMDNSLSGNIPNFDLSSLSYLDLSSNNLSGNIPNFSLPNLWLLHLNNNNLSGSIPNFTNLSGLLYFTVCPGNNLVGTIPSFENCPSLMLIIDEETFNCVEAASLFGNVYYDTNDNCQQDPDEPAISNALIQVNGGESSYYSNSNGGYQIGLDIGTYTFNVQAPNSLWNPSAVCDNTFIANVENFSDIFNHNFPLQAQNSCSLLSVSIGGNALNRCFASDYTVQYCNEGTVTEDGVYIDINLTAALILQTSSLPYTQPAPDIYRFEVGELGISECGSFTFQVMVDCEVELGTLACASANIYPVSDCLTQLIDGYELAVSGDCEGDEVVFTVNNLNGDMADSTQYRIYQEDILSVVGNIKLQAGQQTTISIPNNANLYKLVVEDNSTSEYASDPQVIVNNCAVNTAPPAFALNASEEDNSPSVERDCREIVGSFDPNDKQAIPRGVSEQNIISENEEIEFMIRFQNTGTAEAFNIYILDTLDLTNLDFSTLRMGLSSHAYTTQLTNNVLRINFDNIHLPDSTNNEPGSHGFVKYHIRTKSTLTGGETITNMANIYFDFNDPVATNTTLHTINTAPDAINDSENVLQNEATQLDVTANDLNDEGAVLIYGFTAPEHGTVAIIDGQLWYMPAPGYLGSDAFSYDIMDYFGKTDNATVIVNVIRSSGNGTVHLPMINFSPNPAQGQLAITYHQVLDNDAQFLLFDAMGKQVLRTVLSANQNQQMVQLNDLPTALYSYKIINQQNETVQAGKLTVID